MLYEDVNDLIPWLTEPTVDQEGRYAGPPIPPKLHQWVGPEYLKPVEDDDIFESMSQTLGMGM